MSGPILGSSRSNRERSPTAMEPEFGAEQGKGPAFAQRDRAGLR